MTPHPSRPIVTVCLLLSVTSCTKIYTNGDDDAPGRTVTTTAPSPAPAPAVVLDQIEFRVIGNVGHAPVLIKFSDSINGLTTAVAASLPYVASVRSEESFVFVYLEASAVSQAITVGTLHVQIFVNGKLFREGFAAGFTSLLASASGTYRRGK